MKKSVLSLLLLLSIMLSPAFGQDGGPIDVVLLIDTSSSMYNSYQEVSAYVTGPFLEEFLRLGDTFHLLSFSGEGRLEISRRIEGEGDVRTIIGRLLLMYPLDPYSDIPRALDFAREYIAGIPGGREKKLVMISDGKQDPAPASSSGPLDDTAFNRLISDSTQELKKSGVDFHYVSVPLGTAISSGRPPRDIPSAPSSQATAQDSPSQRPPAAVSGQQSDSALTQTGASSSPSASSGTGTSGSAASQSGQTQSPAPGTSPAGAADTPPSSSAPASGSAGQPYAGQDPAGTPSAGTAGAPGGTSSVGQPPAVREPSGGTPTTTPSPGTAGGTETPRPQGGAGSSQAVSGDFPFFIVIAGIIGALILALIIFFLVRRLQGSPGRTVASAAGGSYSMPDHAVQKQDNNDLLSDYASRQKKGGSRTPEQYRRNYGGGGDVPVNGPLMLSLFVEDQNTAIGRRNIHTAKSGYTLSVGGGKSDFLIFLVPIPPHIADVRFEGSNCTFIPRKPQYFPDIGSNQVSNCIGKTIRVISDKGYELFIRIERYQDPLEALNRLLMSINVPG